MCRFLRSMGLAHPSEPTFARLAGLMAVCSCGTQARDHTPEQMRDLYDHMKEMWKSSQRGTRAPLDHISELPRTPFALQSAYPRIYATAFPEGHHPAAPRVSVVDVCACGARIPMRRRTPSGPAHLQRGSSSPNLGNDPQNMQAMMGMFGTMMETDGA